MQTNPSETNETNEQNNDGSKYLIQDDGDEAQTYTVSDPTDDTDDVDGELFDFAEYELEVGQTTATDEHTDEQYTLWRVEGRPVGTTVEGFREVSPTLPEAVMSVCEALLRERGDL